MSDGLTFESTRRIIDTPDYRIQVNEAGSGHPVLLIHGTGPGATGWSNFAPNIKVLSQTYRCIAVTMPGWGESSPQGVDSGRDQVAAVCQLMDALGIEKAAIVGNSMGGGIALLMAAHHPERVSHVVTMGSGVAGVDILAPGGYSEGIRTLLETYRDPTPANFKRMVAVMCFNQEYATDELAAERSRAALEFPEHNANWLALWGHPKAIARFASLAADLRGCEIPALLIHGRDDRTVHYEYSLRAMSLLPNSRLVLLNRCGHWAQLEHADEFNRLVDGFLSAY